MFPDLTQMPQLTTSITLNQLIGVVILYTVAFIIGRRASTISQRFLKIRHMAKGERSTAHKDDKRKSGLLSGVIKLVTYIFATLASLALFIDSASLLWFIGLFSAGFGIAARPIISDYLTGISLIFEDSMEVGEKVEFPGVTGGNIEGVVETIKLRTTTIRARSGEPIVVPNGEVRVIRNFSRANYSEAKIKIRVKAQDTSQALELLHLISGEAVEILENLVEPWTILSESGELGQSTVLTINYRAKFGMGATLRPRLLVLLQERFATADIHLED